MIQICIAITPIEKQLNLQVCIIDSGVKYDLFMGQTVDLHHFQKVV